MFFTCLDKFGHIGPISVASIPDSRRAPCSDLRISSSPAEPERGFRIWFLQRKLKFPAFDISRPGEHPALSVQVGACLHAFSRMTRYPELRTLANRLHCIDGPCGKNSELPGRLDLIHDAQEQRSARPSEEAKSMYGRKWRCRHLIEPPFHLESRRYKTIRSAYRTAELVERQERSAGLSREGSISTGVSIPQAEEAESGSAEQRAFLRQPRHFQAPAGFLVGSLWRNFRGKEKRCHEDLEDRCRQPGVDEGAHGGECQGRGKPDGESLRCVSPPSRFPVMALSKCDCELSATVAREAPVRAGDSVRTSRTPCPARANGTIGQVNTRAGFRARNPFRIRRGRRQFPSSPMAPTWRARSTPRCPVPARCQRLPCRDTPRVGADLPHRNV